MDEVCVGEVVRVLGNLSAAENVAFFGVLAVKKLLLLMPVTNATSKHSFSTLRRIYQDLSQNNHDTRPSQPHYGTSCPQDKHK